MPCRRRKAVSTLIGALIAISILFTVLIPLIYSFYTTRRAVEAAQAQRLAFIELKERESLSLSFDPTSGYMEVVNKGPVEVTLIRIWVFRSSGVQAINIAPVRLLPGEKWTYTINPVGVESLAVETRRGNVFTFKAVTLQAAVPVTLYNLVVQTQNLTSLLTVLQPSALVGGSVQAVNALQYPAVYRYLFTYDVTLVPVTWGMVWKKYYVPVVAATYSAAGEASVADILFTTDLDGNKLNEVVFSTLGMTVQAVNASTGSTTITSKVIEKKPLGLNSWTVTLELKGPTRILLNYNPADDPSIAANKTYTLSTDDWVVVWVYKPGGAFLDNPQYWPSPGLQGPIVLNGSSLYVLFYHNTTKTLVFNSDNDRDGKPDRPIIVEWLYIEAPGLGSINITPQLAQDIVSTGFTGDISNKVPSFPSGAGYVLRNNTNPNIYYFYLKPDVNDYIVKFKVKVPASYVISFGSKIGKSYSLSSEDEVLLTLFNGTIALNITDPSYMKLYIGWQAYTSLSGGGGGGYYIYGLGPREQVNVVKMFINGKELPDVPVGAMAFEKYGEETTGPIFFVLNKAPITGASAVQVSYRFFYFSSLCYVMDYGYTIDLNSIPNLRVFSVILLKDVNGSLIPVASKDYYLQTLEGFRSEFPQPAFVMDTVTFITNVTDRYYVALCFEDPYLAVTYTVYPLGKGPWWWGSPIQFTGQPLDVCVGVEYISLTRFVPPP